MAISYFNETVVSGKENVVNNYRVKKIRDKYLVSTDQGSWAVLEKKEYDQLMNNKLDDSLFKTLEEKGVIVTKNNLNLIINDYKKRYRYLSNGTSLHIMIPTLRCNHKCIYCHSAAEKEDCKNFDMDKKTAKKTLEFIFQTPAKGITIEFQGGDALLNIEIFKYVVKEAKEMNKIFNKKIRFALVTNLTLMTDELLKWIIKEKVDISTSLDGPKNVHDRNRLFEGGKPTYDTVVKWIEKIKKDYGYRVGALMVTTKHSLPYYKEIVDEYVKHGLTSLQIKYMNKLGFAEKTWEKIGYDMDEFIDFWKKSVDYMIELNKKGVKIKSRYVGLILQKILTKYDPSFLDFRSPCGIVCGQMAYDYNGDIYSCDEGRAHNIFKLGNTKKNGYKEVVSSEQSQQLISASINDNYLCDNCAYKPWCGLCPVIAYAEQGNIIPKIASFSKCKLSKAQFDYVFEKLLFDPEVRGIFFNWLNEWGNKGKTSLNLSKIVKNLYNIDTQIIEIKKGFNDVCIIKNNDKKMILKIYKNRFKKIIQNKNSLMLINKYLLFLNKHNLNVPKPYKNKENGYEINIKNNFASIYNYIDGEKFKKKDCEIKDSAKKLCLFHKYAEKFKEEGNNGKFLGLKKLICLEEENILLNINQEEIKKFLKKYLNNLNGIIETKKYLEFKKIYVHGDFQLHNLIYNDGKINGILDFDCVMYGPRIFDLSVLICSLIDYYSEKELIKKIKILYYEHNKNCEINEFEKKCLINFMIMHLLEQIINPIKNKERNKTKKIISKINWIKENEDVLKKIFIGYTEKN